MRRLATSGALPEDQLLEDDRLQWFLLQEAARDYERMLMVLHTSRMQRQDHDYRAQTELAPCSPRANTVHVQQGYYRIGSRNEPFAYDNELPPQAVELSGYRIAKRLVTNAEYLAFIQAGGYREDSLWSEGGRNWRDSCGAVAPLHWRQDQAGRWHGIGLNGAADLQPDALVLGVAMHEAQAYAAWVGGLSEELAGAVLQHEYQWEVAALGTHRGDQPGVGMVLELLPSLPRVPPLPGRVGIPSGFQSRSRQPARGKPAYPAVSAPSKRPQPGSTRPSAGLCGNPFGFSAGLTSCTRSRFPRRDSYMRQNEPPHRRGLPPPRIIAGINRSPAPDRSNDSQRPPGSNPA